MTTLIERLKEQCPECSAEVGEDGWHLNDESQDWGPLGVGERWHCARCDAYLVLTDTAALIQLQNEDVRPVRGGAVHRWLERWRDGAGEQIPGDPQYDTVQAMIDDWTEMADNGVSLLMDESTAG